jgi:hypothetical protein
MKALQAGHGELSDKKLQSIQLNASGSVTTGERIKYVRRGNKAIMDILDSDREPIVALAQGGN